MQWHGEYSMWKWIISTKYIKKKNAYIWQNTRCRGAKTHWGLDYYMTINAVALDCSNLLRLHHCWTHCNIAHFGGNEMPYISHPHHYMKWYAPIWSMGRESSRHTTPMAVYCELLTVVLGYNMTTNNIFPTGCHPISSGWFDLLSINTCIWHVVNKNENNNRSS